MAGVNSGRMLRFCFGAGSASGVKKFVKNQTQIPSHFSILSIAEVSVVISNAKPLLIFGYVACSRSLNRSRFLKIEKFPDPDQDSKLLKQEQSRSLKR